MKKFLSISIFLVALGLVLGLNGTVLSVRAQTPEPIGQLDQVLGGGKSGLTNFAGKNHQLSNTSPGADAITSIIFYGIDFLKYLLGGIAVLFAIIAGIKLITSAKKVDEVAEKEKENLKYIIYGLILVMIADELVTKVFFGDYGECLASASNAKNCAQAGGTLIKGMYSFILSILASLSIFIIAMAAFRMITAFGEEEVITKEKKRLFMALVGILVAGLGEFVVKGIVFPEGGQTGIDSAAAQKLVTNFTNFVASFIGAGAFLMFFYAGWLYVTSAGNEEMTGKAKKIMMSAVIGIVVALAAFGIVRTVTSFQAGKELKLPGQLPGVPTNK